jgi:aromatic ring-opening dioxygenase catalytic subunit (LigB family)
MGEIVAVTALSHAPGLTGWLDRATPAVQHNLIEGYREIGRLLRAAKPDVIVGIANDHLLNFPPDNVPDFCVGTAASWSGPAEWFRDWLNVQPYRLAGHPALAKTLVREGVRAGVNFAFSDALLFDDNWSVPLSLLTPAHDIPLVPIHMNCVMPPLPAPARCFEVGRVIAEVIRRHRPAGERVAIMATGGLSHDPGGPKYFKVDENFDRWFLDLLGRGDAARVLREVTIDKMVAAGDGGTTELLSWLVALGTVGDRKARTICYEPTAELRSGMGAVIWPLEEAAA